MERPEEYYIFSELWLFYKKYYQIVDNSEKIWDQIIADGDELYKKHPSNTTMEKLLMTVIELLEDKVKGNKNGEL